MTEPVRTWRRSSAAALMFIAALVIAARLVLDLMGVPL